MDFVTTLYILLVMAVSQVSTFTLQSNPTKFVSSRVLSTTENARKSVIVSVKPPAEIYDGAVALGVTKASFSVGKIFKLGLISGAHIGFGAYLAMSVGGACPGIAQSNPGLARWIYGAVFPLGLLMTSITGGELFTGNAAVVTAALAEGKITFGNLVKSWSVSYIANFIGSVLFAALVLKAGTLTASTLPLTIATAKVGLPFDVAFFRAVLCNWLVCMAVYMSSGCQTLTEKIIAIWFPISAFVAIGLEHSVANMFFIPFAMMSGANISISQLLYSNILPVTLGNIVGAILCVMLPFGTSFGKWFKEDY